MQPFIINNLLPKLCKYFFLLVINCWYVKLIVITYSVPFLAIKITVLLLLVIDNNYAQNIIFQNCKNIVSICLVKILWLCVHYLDIHFVYIVLLLHLCRHAHFLFKCSYFKAICIASKKKGKYSLHLKNKVRVDDSAITVTVGSVLLL